MTVVSTDRRRGVNAGQAIKVPCKAGTTANITLSGEKTIDGISCVEGDRVLVKDQTDSVENGIYAVSTGSWRREPDWDGVGDITEGTLVYINQGTVNEGSNYKVDTTGDIIPGTTEVSVSLTPFGDIGAVEDDVADLDLRVAALETETPVPDDPTTILVSASVLPNRLVTNILITGYTGVGGAITVNTTATPTATTWTGAAPTSYQTPSADWGVTETLRFWEVDSLGAWTEIKTESGVSGISVSYVATDPPLHVSTFSVQSVTATTATVTVVATTAVDDATGSNIQYDVIDAGTGALLSADATPGTVVVDSLIPDTTYQFAQRSVMLSDPSREDISNIVSQDTGSVGTISFSFTPKVDSLVVSYATFVVTDSAGTTIDEVHLNTTGEAPTSSSTFIPVPTLPDTYTVPGYGVTTVYCWGRDATYPTSISAVSTADATATRTSSAATFSIAEISADISEENQPVYTLTIRRGDSTTGDATISLVTADGTDAEGAEANTNYSPINTTVTCADGDAETEVEIPIFTRNLGHNNGTPNRRWFTATISSPSTGAVVSGQDVATINIYGCYKTVAGQKIGGYYANGQIDLNALPVDLPKDGDGVLALSGVNSETFDKINYDSSISGAFNTIQMAAQTAHKTFTDCIIQNAKWSAILTQGPIQDCTFKHCAFVNWNASLRNLANATDWGNLCFDIRNNNVGTPTTNLEILGCNAKAAGRFAQLQYGASKGIVLKWNKWENTMNFTDLATGRTTNQKTDPCKDGHFIQFADNPNGGQNYVFGNIIYWPASTFAGSATFDAINWFYRLPNEEADRCWCECNMLLLSTDVDHEGSSVGIIVDSPADGTQGYITVRYNTISNSANIGMVVAGSNFNVRDNDIYSPDIPALAHENGIGFSGRQDTPILSSSTNGNNIFWHAWNADNTTRPAHFNASLVSSDQNIMTNWQTNGTANTGGELLVKQRHPVINNPAFSDGIHILFSHYDTPAGNGILWWDDSEDQLLFRAYGESYGTAVDISLVASGDAGDWDAVYDIPSSSSSGIRVVVDPTTLNSKTGADIFWEVKCTNLLFQTYFPDPYDQDTGIGTAGVYGDWAGNERTTETGTVQDVPTNVDASSASATSIDVTWDAVVGADSYRVYRSIVADSGFVLVASPTTNSYTDTGLTEGTKYYYSVASSDAGVLSEKSAVVSAIPVNASAIIVGGEFDQDSTDAQFGSTYYTDWSRKSNCTVTVSGGQITIVNSDPTYEGWIEFSKTGLTLSASAYNVEGSVSSGTTLIDFDTAIDNPDGARNNGDVLTNQSINTANSPYTHATSDPATWADTTRMFVVLRVAPTETIVIDYIRLVEA